MFFCFFIIIELFFFSSKARLRANKMCVCRFAFVVKVQERSGWPPACSLTPLDSLGTKLKEILRNYYWKREWRWITCQTLLVSTIINIHHCTLHDFATFWKSINPTKSVALCVESIYIWPAASFVQSVVSGGHKSDVWFISWHNFQRFLLFINFRVFICFRH